MRWRLLEVGAWFFKTTRVDRLTTSGPYLMLAPAVIAVGTLAVGLIVLTWSAFHDFDVFLNAQGELSTGNFVEILSSAHYRGIFIRTITITCLVTVLSVAWALPIAYMVVRSASAWVRTGLLVAIFIPFLIGDVVRAYGWLVIGAGNGPLAGLAEAVGVADFTLTGSPIGVVLGLLQLMVPLCAIILIPTIHAIDPELEQASTVMGARAHQTWVHVLFPLARKGVVAAAAVSYTLTVTAFASPRMLGNGQYDFVANTIHEIYFTRGNTNLASAYGVIMLIFSVAVVTLILSFGGPSRRRTRRLAASRRAADARLAS